MKTTLDLPDALVKEVKLRALHDGRKLKDAVAELLRAGLVAPPIGGKGRSGKPKRIVIKKDRRTGLPVIQCPADAPARRMRAKDLLAMEHQSLTREDLERLTIPFRH